MGDAVYSCLRWIIVDLAVHLVSVSVLIPLEFDTIFFWFGFETETELGLIVAVFFASLYPFFGGWFMQPIPFKWDKYSSALKWPRLMGGWLCQFFHLYYLQKSWIHFLKKILFFFFLDFWVSDNIWRIQMIFIFNKQSILKRSKAMSDNIWWNFENFGDINGSAIANLPFLRKFLSLSHFP